MDHQPFKDWLLSEDALSAEQVRSLQDHLAHCDSCSQIDAAWNEINKNLQSAPEIGPEPGFPQRWQARLADFEKRQQKDQGWVSIGITAIIAAALIAILVYQAGRVMQDPNLVIAVWLNQLVSLISNYYILRTLLTSSTWLNPINFLVVSFFIIGMISFMSVFWMSIYQKITIKRRIE